MQGFDMLPFRRILILAPHTDDAELGCGGLINRASRENIIVEVVCFSSAQESIPKEFPRDQTTREFESSMRFLGVRSFECLSVPVRSFPEHRQAILDKLISVRSHKYDLVCIPSRTDVHQDHQVVCREAIRAFKGTTIFGYELPWNQLSNDNTCLVKLTDQDISAKARSLAMYETQKGRPYVDPVFIESLARVRGIQCGSEFAENYEVLRWVIN